MRQLELELQPREPVRKQEDWDPTFHCHKRRADGLHCMQAGMLGHVPKKGHTRAEARIGQAMRLKFCRVHAGSQRQGAGYLAVNKLPSFYRNRLGPTLTKYLAEVELQTPPERVAAYEELAIIKHAAGQAVVLYDAAVESGNAELQLSAGVLAGEAMKEVIKCCDQVARIEAVSKDKISVLHLKTVVNQILLLAHKCFGDLPIEYMERFRLLVENEIKMPSAEAQGTNLTPDVLAMDATIPAAPEDDDDDDTKLEDE